MSVRQGLLALLAQGPRYGAQLRAEFEERTGATWPLNVGQVYSTLGRLERDGLVEAAGGPDADGRIAYRLTPAGQAEVDSWWTTPVSRADHPRDELAIKLALAVTLPGVDVPAVVQTQRTQTLRGLQELTRLKRRATEADDLAWLLVLDNLVFAAEAEVRWLDHVETRLVRATLTRRTTSGGAGAATPASVGSTPQDRAADTPASATAGASRSATTDGGAR